MNRGEYLHARILEELDLSREVQDDELTEIIYRVLQEAGRREYLPLAQKSALGRELFNAFRKLDLLQEFLEDEDYGDHDQWDPEYLPGKEGKAVSVG